MLDLNIPHDVSVKDTRIAKRKLNDLTGLSQYSLGNDIINGGREFLNQLCTIASNPTEAMVRKYLSMIGGGDSFISAGDIVYGITHEGAAIEALCKAKVDSLIATYIEILLNNTDNYNCSFSTDNAMNGMTIGILDKIILLNHTETPQTRVDEIILLLGDNIQERQTLLNSASSNNSHDVLWKIRTELEAIRRGPKLKKVIETLQRLVIKDGEYKNAVIRLLITLVPDDATRAKQVNYSSSTVLGSFTQPSVGDLTYSPDLAELLMEPDCFNNWTTSQIPSTLAKCNPAAYRFMENLVKYELYQLYKVCSTKEMQSRLSSCIPDDVAPPIAASDY